ncbi:MAG: hypothetical protein ACK5MD_00810 [Flavobacteriales bacterium]
MKNQLTIQQQQAILRLFDMVIVADQQIDLVESRFEELLIQKFGFDEMILIEPNELSRSEAFEILKKLKKPAKNNIIKALEKLADSNLIRTENESKVILEVKAKIC